MTEITGQEVDTLLRLRDSMKKESNKKGTKMSDNDAATMRSWASIALKNEGYDPRRDVVARFILNNVDDPYEEIEIGSVYLVKFRDEERVALRGETRWYLCETDEAFSDVTEVVELVSELVPESTLEHPEVLTTEEDYENAPVGTIVAVNGYWPHLLTKSGWLGPTGNYANHSEMASILRRVLRWGWES